MLAGQLALAMMLAAGALLFTASLRNARTVDLGMSLDRVLVSELNLQGAGYTPEDAHALIDALLDRLRAVPGVRSVALSDADPHPGFLTYPYTVPGQTDLPQSHSPNNVFGFSAVTPAFLSTLGTRIEQGRDFTDADRSARVIIVSHGFAQRNWPGESPLGRCVKIGGARAPCAQVIGVAQDRHAAPGDTATLIEAFVPLGSPAEPAQLATLFPLSSVALRVDGDPARVAPQAQRILEEMLPDVPTIHVRSASSLFDRALRPRQLGASMVTVFAAIALALALFGVYAAMTYLVVQRTREIAIRVALGATAGDVSRLVVGETLRVTAVGASVGVVASVLLGRGIRGLLFGIAPLDPWVYGAAAFLLVCTALVASAVPTCRALRVDPTVTLRAE